MSRKQTAIILVLGLVILLLVALIVVGSLLGWNFRKNGASAQDMVACKDLTTLRDLRTRLVPITNGRTGDTMRYVIVGDAAKSSEPVVLFNGTSQILADWHIQMLTNRAASPNITTTGIYDTAQDSINSLCHDYRLVLFDYPGIGDSPLNSALTLDRDADNVDAMLEDIARRYQISTTRVNLVGWSLGTLMALKYALLSPAMRPERTIDNVILIAAKPGGNTDGFENGHQAQCVSTFFDTLKDPSLNPLLRVELESRQVKLMYPYVNQQPYDGLDSGCTASVDSSTNTITQSVEANCPVESECAKMTADWLLNRKVEPWSKTDGVSQALYEQQRQVVADWNVFYCAAAAPNFVSTNCSGAPNAEPQMAATNGGVCQTLSNPPNLPISKNCAALQLAGKLTVINGREDLEIQWTYGKALVEGYQQTLGADKATLVTYDGTDGAGHAILLQHPKWVQDQIYAALQPSN